VSVARTGAIALTGLEGRVVDVEVDVAPGVPKFLVVGLPDTSVNEARDRVRSAVLNSGLRWPDRRVTVNLSPGWVRKRGSSFDLALATAVLAADDQLPAAAVAPLVVVGELGLDGRVRRVRGVLPMTMAALAAGRSVVVVPGGSAAEAALVPAAHVVPVATLGELVGVLRGEQAAAEVIAAGAEDEGDPGDDLADVVGQERARSALEVAAAGGHHLLLHGAPGAGKTMLARRLPGLLPELGVGDRLEVTALHSVAGALPEDHPLIRRPPFQSPHHTASAAAVVGGGSGVPRPGAVSLAHRGVLFLDEAPEFSPRVLDTLRQPLESGEVTIARADAVVRYPAAFQLVLAANPCPCGQSFGRGDGCTCTPWQKIRYRARLSGPMLDRVDLRVPLLPVDRAQLLEAGAGERSADVRQRVLAARARSEHRFAAVPWRTNSEVPGRDLRDRFRPDPAALGPLAEEVGRGRLSARGVDRVLRVAWTVADLAGVARPGAFEVEAALGLRGLVSQWAG
jgi:magnesium chelatase family protein